MSIKTDLAKRKLAEECQGKDELIPFEEYLTNICTNDKVAECILKEDRSLKKAVDKVREVARKRAVGGTGWVPDAEAYHIIQDYYGITEDDLNTRTSNPAGIVDITDFL